MSHGAFAVAKDESGKTIFIENACPDDELEYEIYDDRKTFAYASIVNLIQASSQRAKEPKCKIHKICGSCQWQHIDYQEQLKFKKQNLIDLMREAQLEFDFEIPDLIGMDDAWNFRNKVVYPVDTVEKSGRLLAGYFKRNSNELINIKYCPIQYSIFDEIFEKLKEICSQEGVTKEFLRHILLRSNHNKKQILVSLIVRKKNLPEKKYHKLKKVLKEISEKYKVIKTTTINYNDNSTNVILGNETEIVTGKGFILENFAGVDLEISTESFFQVNTEQFAKIIDTLDGKIKEGSKILDAYCGIGTISLSLAKRKQLQIKGIEIVEAAVENAQRNAERNGLEAQYICSKMEDKVEELAQEDFDLIITNPPRKGCTNKVLENLAKIQAKEILYVSCNPSTLARDLKYMEKYGYKTSYLQSFDMFPHSFHFETVAVLTAEK